VPTVPPLLVRRCVLAPLMPVLAGIALVALPVTALVSGVVGVVGLARGARPRWRAVRVVTFATVYLLGETITLLGCLVLWVATLGGLQSRRGWSQRGDAALLRAFLGTLIAVAGPVFGLRLVVEEPARHPEDTAALAGPQPVVVLARHAGPGASFVLVHLLVARWHRRPRVVLKETLRLDPAIDVLLTRLGAGFIASPAPQSVPARGEAVAAIELLARGLGEHDALLLYPEGADWTPRRHARVVRRLRQRGLTDLARRASAETHVLPPRSAGAAAALRGAPDALVAVVTHTGHDELTSAAAVWAALPLRAPLHLIWWRVPPAEVPSDEPAVQAWLQDTWSDIDAWVAEQQLLTAASS